MVDVLTKNQTFATPSEALEHYGVKGMRWGVRKNDKSGGTDLAQAPPSRQQRRREEAAGRLRTLSAKQSRIAAENRAAAAATKPGVLGAYPRSIYTNQAAASEKAAERMASKADDLDSGKARLTPTQKRLLIGGAVVGTLALGITYSNMQQSGQLNSMKLRGKAFIKGEKFDFKKNDALKHAKTPDEVQDLVVNGLNPGYSKDGGKMNCRRCTFAYELRRRGYDVDATTSFIGSGQSETGLLNALTPGKRNYTHPTSLSQQVRSGAGIRAKATGDKRQLSIGERFSAKNATDHRSVLDTFRKMPDGARGEAVFNFGQFGHSLAFERFGDKTYIFDTQKGKRYNVDDKADYDSFLTKWGYNNVKDIQMTRLDNVELDNKFLSRWATNRKTSVS